MTRGVYPGTFNPPTVGHTAICRAAIATYELTTLDLVISRRPLAKDAVERPSLDQRLEVIRASVAHLGVVRAVVTDARLIADIAAGYDVVVMGADKWRQVNDVAFYDSERHRDASLAALPRLAVAARGDDPVPDHARLEVATDTGADLDEVSSTGARHGRVDWMTPQARASGLWG